jgi:hypothetical protein
MTPLFGTQQFATRLTPSPNQEVWPDVHKKVARVTKNVRKTKDLA